MSVIAVCGLPGSGKSLFITNLMIKHYKSENGLFKRLFFKNKVVNNIFSNFPIKLYRKVYSNSISLNDLNLYRKYPMNSDLVFDEFQLYFDSLDFKNFPKVVRANFQLHRHFGINNIYILSQHPSRIVKQARVLVCEFYEIVRFVKIPLIGIGFFRYNVFYNYEDFGKPVNVKKADVTYKFKKKCMFFNYRRAFKAYNTKFMRSLVDYEPLISKIPYQDSSMTKKEIYDVYGLGGI